MSSDAKAWKDKDGWHGICDEVDHQINSSEYGLSDIITYIEDEMEQQLNWEVFKFGNELGLRGYRAKP